MIYLKLFLTFLKIGAVSFGGGYGMISLMRDDCLANGWLGEGELLNYIAIAESTPGPIAVNMATFIGYEQGGFLGALLATVGVVLPSFIIILIVAALIKNLMKYPAVNAFVMGMRPALGGLILATAATMALKVFIGLENISSTITFDWRTFAILAVVVAVPIVYKKLVKKEFSPILLIIVSAGMGILFFA